MFHSLLAIAGIVLLGADGGSPAAATYRVVRGHCLRCPKDLGREDFAGSKDCGDVTHSSVARQCVATAMDAGVTFQATVRPPDMSGFVLGSTLASRKAAHWGDLFGRQRFGRLADGGFEVLAYEGMADNEAAQCRGAVVRESCSGSQDAEFLSMAPAAQCGWPLRGNEALCVERFQREAPGFPRSVSELRCASYYGDGYEGCRPNREALPRRPSPGGPNLICADHGSQGLRCLPDQGTQREASVFDEQPEGRPPCTGARVIKVQQHGMFWALLVPDGGHQSCPARDELFDPDPQPAALGNDAPEFQQLQKQ